MQQTRGILASTLCVAIVAVLAVFAMLLAIPGFTVPSLLHTFASLPVDYYGSLTVSLLRWSELIQVHWPFIAVFVVGGAALVLWSLPNAADRKSTRLNSSH